MAGKHGKADDQAANICAVQRDGFGAHRSARPAKGIHALRHTFATRVLECGMDVKTLSEILGHKSASVTLNRYVHSLIEHKQEMMNKVGKLLQ